MNIRWLAFSTLDYRVKNAKRMSSERVGLVSCRDCGSGIAKDACLHERRHMFIATAWYPTTRYY